MIGYLIFYHRGNYKSVQTLRQDWEMMCLNAIIFNKPGDEYWREAERCYYAGIQVFSSLTRQSHLSAFGVELKTLLEKYYATLPASTKQGHTKSSKKSTNYEYEVGNNVDKNSSPVDHTNNNSSNSNDNSKLLDALPSQIQDHKEEEDDAIIGIPTELSEVCEPTSFLPCLACVISIEDAYYSCYCDQCLICGSPDSSQYFLICIDCGETYHSFCVDAPLATMGELQRKQWRCTNCKVLLTLFQCF
jgi:hypothetical protein